MISFLCLDLRQIQRNLQPYDNVFQFVVIDVEMLPLNAVYQYLMNPGKGSFLLFQLLCDKGIPIKIQLAHQLSDMLSISTDADAVMAFLFQL